MRRRLASAAMVALPSLLVAASSPSVFLKAIDFAGSYPVLLLWGVLPPAMALAMRRADRRKRLGLSNTGGDIGGIGRRHVPSGGPALWLLALMAGSLGLVGMSAVPDARAAAAALSAALRSTLRTF